MQLSHVHPDLQSDHRRLPAGLAPLARPGGTLQSSARRPGGDPHRLGWSTFQSSTWTTFAGSLTRLASPAGWLRRGARFRREFLVQRFPQMRDFAFSRQLRCRGQSPIRCAAWQPRPLQTPGKGDRVKAEGESAPSASWRGDVRLLARGPDSNAFGTGRSRTPRGFRGRRPSPAAGSRRWRDPGSRSRRPRRRRCSSRHPIASNARGGLADPSPARRQP